MINKDYGRYNSTVKTVQTICEQAKNGYFISKDDIEMLNYAIEDLQNIANNYSNKGL